MSSQTVVTSDASSANTTDGPGYQQMSPGWISIVALYLVVLSLLVLYGLLKVWPYPTPSGEPKDQTEAAVSQESTAVATPTAAPTTSPTPVTRATATPSPQAGAPVVTTTPTGNATPPATRESKPTPATAPKKELPEPELISFFGGYFKANIYLETRLLLLVMLAGALGSLMHSLRSLYWYTGNRKMVWSWVAFYMLLPLTGAMLAVIFYLVVRGGFFSPQASTETTSPFGFAALSALVGLFSPQATLKLKEVAETIFTKPPAGADTKPQEPAKSNAGAQATAPTITSVIPVSSAAGEKVVITGTGFGPGTRVKVGDKSADVTSATDTTVEILTPSDVAAGLVDIEVKNAQGGIVTLAQGFTFNASSATGGGQDADELDGHDGAITPDTTDEELPITEGGVK